MSELQSYINEVKQITSTRDKIIDNIHQLYIYNDCMPITREEKEVLDFSPANVRCATLADVELIERNMFTSDRVAELIR